MRARNVIASLLVAALCLGCSSPATTDEGSRSRLGKDRGNAAGKQDKNKKEKKKERAEERVEEAIASGAAPGTAPGGTDDTGSDLDDADTPRSGIDPSLARASSREEEPTPDAVTRGVPPSYTEVNAIAVEGLGENFRVTFSFNGEVPERLPKDTFMVFGFAVSGRKKDEGYAFGVNGTSKGWQPYAGKKGEAREFPGTFDIQGRQVVIVLPWDSIEGPRAFEWYANSSWFSSLAGQDMYAFDPVPNENAGRFPGE